MADTSKTGVAEGTSSKVEEAPKIPVAFPKTPEYQYGEGVIWRTVGISTGTAIHGEPVEITPPKSLIFSHHSVPRPTYQAAPPGQEYVAPYLFETGHFENRKEYEELSRTTKIKPRTRA